MSRATNLQFQKWRLTRCVLFCAVAVLLFVVGPVTWAAERLETDVRTEDLILSYLECTQKAGPNLGNQQAHKYCTCVSDLMRYEMTKKELLLVAADVLQKKGEGALDHELIGVSQKLQLFVGRCLKKSLGS